MNSSKNDKCCNNTDESIVLIEGISVIDNSRKIFTLGNSGDVHCIVRTNGKHTAELSFLRKICENIYKKYSNKDLEIELLDCASLSPERTKEVKDLTAGNPDILWSASSVEVCKDVIEDLCEQVDARYTKLLNSVCRSIMEYNKTKRCSKSEIIPRKLVIIRAADVLFKEKDTKAMNEFMYLYKLGRATGIHLICVIDDWSVVTDDSDIELLLNQCALRFSVGIEGSADCFVAESCSNNHQSVQYRIPGMSNG